MGHLYAIDELWDLSEETGGSVEKERVERDAQRREESEQKGIWEMPVECWQTVALFLSFHDIGGLSSVCRFFSAIRESLWMTYHHNHLSQCRTLPTWFKSTRRVFTFLARNKETNSLTLAWLISKGYEIKARQLLGPLSDRECMPEVVSAAAKAGDVDLIEQMLKKCHLPLYVVVEAMGVCRQMMNKDEQHEFMERVPLERKQRKESIYANRMAVWEILEREWQQRKQDETVNFLARPKMVNTRYEPLYRWLVSTDTFHLYPSGFASCALSDNYEEFMVLLTEGHQSHLGTFYLIVPLMASHHPHTQRYMLELFSRFPNSKSGYDWHASYVHEVHYHFYAKHCPKDTSRGSALTLAAAKQKYGLIQVLLPLIEEMESTAKQETLQSTLKYTIESLFVEPVTPKRMLTLFSILDLLSDAAVDFSHSLLYINAALKAQDEKMMISSCTSLVEYLIGKGADINARDPTTNKTPLLCAVESSTVLAYVLLAKGANIQLQSKSGNALCALMHRSCYDDSFVSALRLLAEYGLDYTEDRTYIRFLNINNTGSYLPVFVSELIAMDIAPTTLVSDDLPLFFGLFRKGVPLFESILQDQAYQFKNSNLSSPLHWLCRADFSFDLNDPGHVATFKETFLWLCDVAKIPIIKNQYPSVHMRHDSHLRIWVRSLEAERAVSKRSQRQKKHNSRQKKKKGNL